MLADFEQDPIPFHGDCDICIVGSGPAGLTVAHELLTTGLSVILLETGGFSPGPASSGVAPQPSNGYPPLEEMRQQRIGGTANMWHIVLGRRVRAARYTPLDPIDFESRPGLRNTGWPIGPADLHGASERAQVLCELGPYAYDAAAWTTPEAMPIGTESPRLVTSVFQFGSRAAFTRRIFDDIRKSPSQYLLQRATAAEIETDADGRRVIGLRIVSRRGRQATLRCRRVVLAAGGVENARLLLLSRRVWKNGIANEYDNVGRYFMDHPLGPVDRLTLGPSLSARRLKMYDIRKVRDTHVMAKLHLSPDVMRRESLTGLSAILFPRRAYQWSTEVDEAKQAMRALRRGRIVPAVTHGWRAAGGLHHVLAFAGEKLGLFRRYNLTTCGWSRLKDADRLFDSFEVMYQVEQSPERENRVCLDERTDAFGLPAPRIQWRFSEADRQRMNRSRILLHDALRDEGIGHLELLDRDFFSLSTHHHLGTTRMHNDARQGVVDRELQVHGVANLYVAGGSVFPTGSYANPTLTIIALSIRLADHIREKFATGEAA